MESEFLNRLGKLNINNGVDFKSVEASSTSSSFRKVTVERIQLNTPVKDDKIRIVCISDTHSVASKMLYSVPKCDILIHAGDFTRAGRPKEIINFSKYLGSLNHVKHKIVIAGNHELTFDRSINPRSNVNEYKKLLENCIYLEDSGVNLLGLKFYGSPWQPIHAGNAFQLHRGQALVEKWDKIPNDTDILITHGPPFGFGDITHEKSVGCNDLLMAVQNRVKPKFHIFGHIHKDPGIWTDGNTTYVNAAICDNHYNPIYEPILIDVELPQEIKR